MTWKTATLEWGGGGGWGGEGFWGVQSSIGQQNSAELPVV